MKKTDRAPMKKAQKVNSLIKEMLGKPGFGEQITRHQAWLVWDQIVGEQIAAHARPRKFRKGVLEIQVDHPVGMQQLHMLKPKILEKINSKVPTANITDIYLRQTKAIDAAPLVKKSKTPEPLPWENIELNKWEIKAIEEELTSLDNDEVKEGFRKLLTLQKQVDKNREA